MTQHSLKRGIKEIGNTGVEAVLKELQQLHDGKVLHPKDSNDISMDEQKEESPSIFDVSQKEAKRDHQGSWMC